MVPATAELGEIELRVGTGYVPTLTVKIKPFEGLLIGGFDTSIKKLPGKRIVEAGTVAVSCVELTKVVLSGVPVPEGPARTVAPLKKFEPFTVRVKAGSPEFALAGESDVIVGVG